MLVKQALIAKAALDNGAAKGDVDFYTGKIAAAMDNELMAVPESAF